jgi:hypothetical protein
MQPKHFFKIGVTRHEESGLRALLLSLTSGSDVTRPRRAHAVGHWRRRPVVRDDDEQCASASLKLDANADATGY